MSISRRLAKGIINPQTRKYYVIIKNNEADLNVLVWNAFQDRVLHEKKMLSAEQNV